MKKLLGIVILGLLLCVNTKASIKSVPVTVNIFEMDLSLRNNPLTSHTFRLGLKCVKSLVSK